MTQGCTGHGHSEESHGGGGLSALSGKAEDPTLPDDGHGEDLTNLVSRLSTHNLLGLASK